MNDPNDPFVRELIDAYLELGMDEAGEQRRRSLRSLLGRFGAAFGEQRISAVKPIPFLRWLKGNPAWASPHSLRNVLKGVKAFLNWCVKMDLIAKNPLQWLSAPAAGRRRPMAPAEFQALLRHAHPELKRALVFLKLTGCRASEMAGACWEDLDEVNWLLVIRQHKTVKKTGRPRLLYLTPPLRKLLAYLCRRARSASGPIFRNSAGRRWQVSELSQRLQALRERLGLPRGCVAHGLRHAFITEALRRGVPIVFVAQLVGHGSIKTTEGYAHISGLTEDLHRAALQATRGNGKGGAA